LKTKGNVNQRDHHGDLNERTDHSRKRRAGVDAEDRYSNGNSEFEFI
jgi:hypothetical protein